MKHLEDYTKTPWTRGLSTEYVIEGKVWGFLFYQAHWSKRKQGGILKADETKIYTRNSDTNDCDSMLRRILIGGTTQLVGIAIDIKSLAILNLTNTSLHT